MSKIKQQYRLSVGLIVALISATSVYAQVAGQPAAPATLEKVSVREKSHALTVEVVLSRPAMPKVVTLKDPDRFVLEFVNTEPGRQPLRTQVDRGGIKALRIGEDGGNPPMTRVVLDLMQPREYKLVQNQNKITLVPGSSQSSRSEVSRAEDYTTDPPDGAEGSAKSKGSNVAPSRAGSDPTYNPPAQPPAAEGGSSGDATDGETAGLTTQPEQPAAGLLSTLPLQGLSLSPLLGPPTAIAVPEQIPEDSHFDLKEHNQTTNAMLAYSKTVPVMAENFLTASDAVVTPTRSGGMGTAPTHASGKIKDRELAAQGAADREFVIGPGDVLAINVWKEPDISRVIPVRSDGKISLPLVGELQASGETPVALEAEISRGLKAYISEPTVAVIVQEIRSRKYNVLGQVTKPGSYVLINSATVLDAIAVAGGFRDFAKKKSIYVLRQDPNGKESRLPFNYTKVVKGTNLEQNVTLRPGDTIIVP